MTFTAQYTNAENTAVSRSDMPGASIPVDLGNRHYAEILAAVIEIAPYVAPPPSANDVSRERDRRLALGFDYDFGDIRGVHRFATTKADMEGWDEVTKASEAMRALGLGSATIGIVTDTGPATVTADEWPAILLAATQYRQPIWQASFVIQSMNPIPDDYAKDSRWP